MRKGKDEKLGALFREYIGESEAPPPQVMQAAKQALEEQSVAEFAEEPVAVAAGGRGHFTPRRKAEIGVLLAVVVCAVALLVYYLLSHFVFSAGTLSLDWTQLDKVSAEYTEKEFVPFVKENSVTQYDEFLLNEDSPYYEEYEGEIVFNTSMAGYQEILTDPSYCSQIVTLTYPLIGNYGAAKKFNQSRKCFFNGFIIGELCDIGSNWQKEEELAEFLKAQDIPCLYNVDTRAVTRHIRSLGAMKGVLVPETATQEEIDALMKNEIPKEVVKIVTTPKTYKMENPGGPHVVVMDFGIKQHILDSLHGIGCDLTIVPADTKADEIMALNPDGIFLSNGPGDPKDLPEIIEVVREIAGKKPTFGICLGHQLLSLAFGADTYKLKFGHRGSNQPVKNLLTGRVHITSQNHGYAVDEESLKGLPLEVTHRAVNDGTVEGIRHTQLPIFSVQYHPEASPGPDDNRYLFDQFWAMLQKGE